ncbi:MAG: GDSL-type esterase/lipase family protein [Spirochaetaceae bacterium]|jgi:lysophospholipase L1-like esterase|nr:GDSL-type esterase/lipase family protein [Spirochaetaceae bacterium]
MIMICGLKNGLFFSLLFSLMSFLSCTTVEQKERPVPEVPLNDPAIVPAGRTLKWWVDRHNSRASTVVENQKIVFIGDSITQGWERTRAWEELNQRFNRRITNLGFTADQTQHVLWRLENGEFPAGINPEYVALMIGTNNKMPPESTAAGIGKIVEYINAVSPSTKVILFSILPCGSGTDDENTVRYNAVNKIIQTYDGYLNIQYAGIGHYFLDSGGALKEELFLKDRLHLSPEGYDLWKEKILEIIE